MTDGDDMFIIKKTSLPSIDKNTYIPIGIIAVPKTADTKCAMVALKYASKTGTGNMVPELLPTGQYKSRLFDKQSEFLGEPMNKVWLDCATEQPDYMYDDVKLNTGFGYSVAACSCAKFSTIGTDYKEWYVPSINELRYYCDNISSIRDSAFLINHYYPNIVSVWHNPELDSNSTLDAYTYLSCNEVDREFMKAVDGMTGNVIKYIKTGLGIVVPFHVVHTAPTKTGVYAVTTDMKLVLPSKVDRTTPDKYIGVAVVTNIASFIVSKSDIREFTYDCTSACYGRLSTNVSDNKGYIHTLGTKDSELDERHKVSMDVKDWKSGAISDLDGHKNTNIATIVKYSDEYGEYYVPSMGELALMKVYLNDVNDVLFNIGGTPIYKVRRYMSSTLYNRLYYWCLDMNTGMSDIKKITIGMNVRMFIRI